MEARGIGRLEFEEIGGWVLSVRELEDDEAGRVLETSGTTITEAGRERAESEDEDECREPSRIFG